MAPRSFRYVLAGGGTGGHIFPAVSIAQQLKQLDPGAEILFIGARGKMEMEKVPQAGFAIEGLDIAGFNRSSLIKNIGLPFKLIKSWLQVRSIFRRFQPDAAIGVGGYSSFPVLKYAQQQGIPTFIHESNSFAGKTNILLGRKARRVYVASRGMEKFFPSGSLMLTGNPVRTAIRSANPDREEAARHFGLDAGKPILLVVGGSLGAKSINEAVDAGLDRLLAAGIQVIWQTGKLFERRQASPVGSGTANPETDRRHGSTAYWVGPFITEMDKAYTAADMIVSRAGAMAIAEIMVMGRPAIFVPYPFAAEDHQTANAKEMVAQGAGWMVADADAGRILVDQVIELLQQEATRKAMAAKAASLAVPDADSAIARDIIATLKKGSSPA